MKSATLLLKLFVKKKGEYFPVTFCNTEYLLDTLSLNRSLFNRLPRNLSAIVNTWLHTVCFILLRVDWCNREEYKHLGDGVHSCSQQNVTWCIARSTNTRRALRLGWLSECDAHPRGGTSDIYAYCCGYPSYVPRFLCRLQYQCQDW